MDLEQRRTILRTYYTLANCTGLYHRTTLQLQLDNAVHSVQWTGRDGIYARGP